MLRPVALQVLRDLRSLSRNSTSASASTTPIMATATSNGDGDGALKPPADITIPPKGVQDNIAKTADFIYRRGDGMAETMAQRARADPKSKLSFLYPEDEYYKYFYWYLQQLKEGKGRSALGNQQTVQDTKPKGPPEPPKFRFSARMPNINAQDLDILKATALWTASNGENWLKELRTREAANFQFDFLRPNHSFFQFFRALVEQYKYLQQGDDIEARMEELQQNIKNRFHILERARQRAEYIKFMSQQKEKEEKQAEDEKKEYASIDWHNFSIIATITFGEEDDLEALPPPTTLNDLQSASLEQRAAVASSAKRLEEAMPDEETYYNATQAPSHMQNNMYPPPPPVFAPTVQPVWPAQADYRSSTQKAREQEEARDAAERQAERERAAQAQAAARGAPGSMRIRNDYVPRAAAKKGNVATVICPNCNQQFPTDEMDEHLRIELLDPRWKEMRDKSDSRYATTINTADVAGNLKRFASQRDDIYDGVSGMPITEEEATRRKRAALSYDGQPDPSKDAARLQQMQSMNVQEQLRHIRERHGANQ